MDKIETDCNKRFEGNKRDDMMESKEESKWWKVKILQ